MNKYCSNFTQTEPRCNLLSKQMKIFFVRYLVIYRKTDNLPDSKQLKKPQENPPQFTDLINYSTTMKGIRDEFVWRFLQFYPFVTLLGN